MAEDILSVLMAIPDFLWAIATSLAGYITGGVVMAMVWAWEHYKNRSLSWRACRYVLGAFLAVAIFSVWYGLRPRLYGEIENKNIGFRTDWNHPALLMVVQIVNTGQPTIAQHWHLKIKLRDGEYHDAENMAITSPVKTGSMLWRPEDALYERAVKEPIPQGGQVIGVLEFRLNDVTLQEAQDRQNEFFLKFDDVTNHTFTAKDKAKDLSGDNPTKGYPGGLPSRPVDH